MVTARETTVRSLIAALALLCFTPDAQAIDDADGLQQTIEAGRLGVMMDQVQQILEVTADEGTPAPTEPFAILKAAVLSYQHVHRIACARHAAGPDVCTSLFDPAWLKEPDVPAPASEVLGARIDDASGRIMPLWSAVCAKLPHDSGLCQLE